MRVLVIDDKQETIDFFSDWLQMAGHEVRVLSSPTLALPTALEFLPEIVFLDLFMPQMDGCEVARLLRRHRELDSAFLVAMSGYSDDREKTHSAGFDVHLMKPVDIRHLELLLKRRPYPAPRLTPIEPQRPVAVSPSRARGSGSKPS